MGVGFIERLISSKKGETVGWEYVWILRGQTERGVGARSLLRGFESTNREGEGGRGLQETLRNE